MFAKPQAEHAWFNDLIGNWEFTHECYIGPDQPPDIATGTMTGRSLCGMWTSLDATGKTPSGNDWTSQFMLGFDPERKRYIGTFVASVMTHLWIYDGQLDEIGTKLILDAEGPKFEGSGMARYQDSIEIVSRDHWILRSRVLGDNGQWTDFMEGHHYRVE